MDGFDGKDTLKLYDDVKGHLKFLVSSDVRVKILISLSKGSKNVSQLREHIGLSSSTILHGMQLLEQKDLVFRDSKIYSLSQYLIS